MIAVLKHELRSAFNSLTVYLFCAALLCIVGVGAMIYNIQASVANFEYVLSFVAIGLVVIIPVLTMRSFAEERKQKTDQLLSLLPITSTDIVLGKYFAMALVFLVPMLVACIDPFIFSLYGDVYLPSAYGALVAFLFLGLALISIGMFISSLTESQGMAAGLCVAAMLLCYYASSLADQISGKFVNVVVLLILALLLAVIVKKLTASGLAGGIIFVLCAAAVALFGIFKPSSLETAVPTLMKTLSPFERFYTFVNGVFDLTGIVYYISIAVFFLFLCVQCWEKKRYNG